jgi:hypothetical protein
MKILAYVIIGAAVLGAGLYFLLSPDSQNSISTQEVSSPFTISSEAPFLIWSSGAAYALVTGELDGTAVVKITGNHGRDLREFTVGPGMVELAYGGAEMWIDDFHISYQPITASGGHLKATVYCGTNLSQTDWDRYHEILRKQ